ncbi:MAG: hypothetical protein AMJ58_00870 [Gammaproteobacteria bacterium SG8_30]|jgi:hypothetical protein|nr:MAG: hypothetical protein AMJ58_00870 [Gammaproteobacteria bacterium SG8_30]
MGFEFESTRADPRRDAEALRRLGELERRWRLACEELDAPLSDVRALAGAPDESARLTRARARLLDARRRRVVLAEQIERLEAELDLDGTLI